MPKSGFTNLTVREITKKQVEDVFKERGYEKNESFSSWVMNTVNSALQKQIYCDTKYPTLRHVHIDNEEDKEFVVYDKTTNKVAVITTEEEEIECTTCKSESCSHKDFAMLHPKFMNKIILS